jgi:hypothetical protein
MRYATVGLGCAAAFVFVFLWPGHAFCQQGAASQQAPSSQQTTQSQSPASANADNFRSR